MPVSLGPLADESRIERVAREAFGYSELRAGQREAIEAALDGRDVLVVMSTGAGKSAIYQIAGLLTPGATVVVSPLIALQRDQVDGAARGRRRRRGAAELVAAARRARGGAGTSWPRARSSSCSSRPSSSRASTCSTSCRWPTSRCSWSTRRTACREWGHDFRPEYLRLGAAIEALGRPPVLALTATAAPPVRDEIVARLGLRDPDLLIRGFDRPNLRFSVERFHGEQGAERKRRALEERIAASPPPGIVYVSTRREAEELAEELCAGSLRAASYHAGMKPHERDDVQERFMDGELDVVVATTAFGMGIDKADVRWVFHAEVAESLDAYYQEAGRAGRDGEPAEIVLFYRSEDVGLRRFFAGGHVEVDELAQVLDAVRRAGQPSTGRAAARDRALADQARDRAGAAGGRGRACACGTDGEVAPVDGRAARPRRCGPRPRPRRCGAPSTARAWT